MAGKLLIPSYTTDLDFPAYQDRLLMKSLGVQAGVIGSEDFKVSAGSGKQVNVKAGKALVEQTKAKQESSNIFYNGLYNVLNPVEQNPSNEVVVSATNPQIAQIVLRVYDVEELGIGGSSYAQIEWLNGTPTSGITEAQMREGIYLGSYSPLPTSVLRLAYVLVPKNAITSTEYYIKDARSTAINTNGTAGLLVQTGIHSLGTYGGEYVSVKITLPFAWPNSHVSFLCNANSGNQLFYTAGEPDGKEIGLARVEAKSGGSYLGSQISWISLGY